MKALVILTGALITLLCICVFLYQLGFRPTVGLGS